MWSKSTPLHIAFGVDRFYVAAMAVTMISLVAHNPGRDLRFHVIVSTMPEEDLARLEQLSKQLAVPINVHRLDAGFFARIPDTKSLSFATYFRLFIGPLLAGVAERVLYMDCDIVCIAPLPELPDLSEGVVAAAALDVDQAFHNASLGRAADAAYFNAGVLYLDVTGWNRLGLTEAALAVLGGDKRYPYLDQDALNIVLKDRWVVLPRGWNSFWHLFKESPALQSQTVLIHYTRDKPWFRWSGDFMEPHFAAHVAASPWPLERLLSLPTKRSHKRIYARHLLRQGNLVEAGRWFVRYLASPKVAVKD